MRQFVIGGPEIPTEVLHALQEDRLVFFCGAGVSIYTGLPNFEKLVKLAFSDCSLKLETRKSKAEKTWDFAFSRGQFDKALDLLERETTRGLMRKKVVERLSIDLPKKLNGVPHVHRALLDLGRHEGGYRLVTTNFDNRFHLADSSIFESHDAPRLAPPRRNEWSQLTFLHGRISEGDISGRSLVLTSADFGRAYLRDAWAARFIVELFREFTVLFVGYSLNDPVMAYLIDALAADMGPERQFRRAFALAGHLDKKGDIERQREEWLAKNIEFIPINLGSRITSKSYDLLNTTLIAWARFNSGGLGSRIVETLKNTTRPYVSGDEQEARNVAWALSDVSGATANSVCITQPVGFSRRHCWRDSGKEKRSQMKVCLPIFANIFRWLRKKTAFLLNWDAYF